MALRRPGRQVLTKDGVNVRTGVARVVEVLGERGQVGVRLGGHAVAVDDNRTPVGEDAQDLGGIDIASSVFLVLLLPDDGTDGSRDPQHDEGDDGDDDDAHAAIRALLGQAHISCFSEQGVDGRVLFLSHDLTFHT